MFKKISLVIVALLSTFLFASDATDTLNMAKMYEKDGEIQKAMQLYKKAALMLVETKEKYIQNGDIVTYGSNSIESYEDPETDKTIKQIIYSAFDIEPYRMNYLLLAVYDNKDHTQHDGHVRRENTETKFQISFKKSLAKNVLGLDDTLYVAYTQISLWQTTAPSSPFRETNYEPEIFVDIPYLSSKNALKSYRVGLVHQSNGKLTQSRSWNRAYLSGIFQYAGLFFEPRVWYRLKEDEKKDINDVNGDDNPDIQEYLGYGDITISYPYKQHLFSAKLMKKSAQFDWTFPIFGFKNVYGYIQVFSGYGESLIDYDERVEKAGLGFAITR